MKKYTVLRKQQSKVDTFTNILLNTESLLNKMVTNNHYKEISRTLLLSFMRFTKSGLWSGASNILVLRSDKTTNLLIQVLLPLLCHAC